MLLNSDWDEMIETVHCFAGLWLDAFQAAFIYFPLYAI